MIVCRFENGEVTASLRHLTVDGVVFDDQWNVLLVKRCGPIAESGKWALVGGYVQRDESASDALRREVLEETGYECSEPRLVGVITNPDRPGDDRQSITLLFAARVGRRVGAPDHESSDIAWFPIESVLSRTDLAFDHCQLVGLVEKHRSDSRDLPILI